MSFEWLPTDENIEKITEEDAKYILEQAEKLLKDLTDTNILIVGRTTTLITLAVGFMLALIGYLFNRFTLTHNLFDAMSLTCGISILYVLRLCKILVENIQGTDYEVAGTEPKKLLIDQFFSNQEDRLKYFYLNEIVVCQDKIKKNIKTNQKRWGLYNKSLRMLLYTPIVIISSFAIIKLLSLYYHYHFGITHHYYYFS